MNRWHGLFVLILLLGGSWIWFNRVPVALSADANAPQPAINYPAPDFVLKTLSGDSFSLREARGRPVVLNFWATWCGPCRANRRTVHGLKSRGQLPERLAVIGVSMDTGPSLVKNFLQSNEANEAEYMASSEFNEFIRTINASPSIPKTLYVDSKGRVADLAEGVQSQNWLKAMARNLR